MLLAPGKAKNATFRVGPLCNLPRLVHSLGHNPAPLFNDCGFKLEQFENPENRLSFVAASHLIDRCVQVTGAEHLGLLLGQMASASHLGLPGFLLKSAPTAGAALQALVENLDLHDQGGVASLQTDEHHSEFRYGLVQAGTNAVEQIYDLATVMIFQILQTVCGDEWRADSVSIARRQPLDISPYQKFFETQVYFNASECSVTFQSRWLEVVPQTSDALLFSHLLDEADRLHSSQKRELLEELPITLHRALLAGQFRSHQVAGSLGLHERTLHRRLQATGTSFRKELDRARYTLSEELLRGTNLPICDIATTLGYADSSGFIRAFQRWTKISPSAWRRQHRETDFADAATGFS